MITVLKCALFTLAMIACVWQGGYSPILYIILTGIGCTIIALTKEVDEVKSKARREVLPVNHKPPLAADSAARLRPEIAPKAPPPPPPPCRLMCGCGRQVNGGTGPCLLCRTVCRDRLAELELAERFNRESG